MDFGPILDPMLGPIFGKKKLFWQFFPVYHFISLLYSFWGRIFNNFSIFFNAFLDMRPAVVATPILFTDVRFTSVKHRFVTTKALNRHYVFNIFLFDIYA